MKVLIFTGEILNEKLWVDVLDADADSSGIILKTGELLTRRDVSAVMDGKQLVFNEPILEKIVERFKAAVSGQLVKQEALVNFEIDEYDERKFPPSSGVFRLHQGADYELTRHAFRCEKSRGSAGTNLSRSSSLKAQRVSMPLVS